MLRRVTRTQERTQEQPPTRSTNAHYTRVRSVAHARPQTRRQPCPRCSSSHTFTHPYSQAHTDTHTAHRDTGAGEERSDPTAISHTSNDAHAIAHPHISSYTPATSVKNLNKRSGCAAARYVDALASLPHFPEVATDARLRRCHGWFRRRTADSASAIYYHIPALYFRGEQPRDVQRSLRVDG